LFDGLYFRSIELPDGKEHDPSLHQESNVVLAMVNLLFGWFLCSQVPYLFGGEAYRTALNLNYADYAVAGFYELMTVVALVFAMVVSLRYFHRERIGHLQKGLYGLLMLQSGIILSSAFIRMNLYIEVYGYTQARIFGMVYILTAGIALVLTLQNVWSESSQAILIKRVLVLSGLSIFTFSLLSPDINSVYWNVEDKRELARKDLSPGELYAAQKSVPYFTLYDEERKVLKEYCTSDWRSFNFRRQRVCSIQ
ncbi:MAG: DUF4173 domain-containing protein, partial [Myxococcota bacterium]|nr:DUF4173 domain-containing protein [Myxococcota bacterium]